MDNPAELADVEASIERPLTSDEERVIPTWLGKAWRELNRVVPGISARNDLDTTDPLHLTEDSVKDVVVAMVERKVRNPDGHRQWQGDDFSATVDSSLSSGQIYVTDAERASLTPTVAYGNGIFSIQLGY